MKTLYLILGMFPINFDDFISIVHNVAHRIEISLWNLLKYFNVTFIQRRLESKTLRICSLPREARLVFTLIGRQQTKVEKSTGHERDGPASRKSGEYVNVLKELGSASLQIFSYEL